jgi:hypothetical protein
MIRLNYLIAERQARKERQLFGELIFAKSTITNQWRSNVTPNQNY